MRRKSKKRSSAHELKAILNPLRNILHTYIDDLSDGGLTDTAKEVSSIYSVLISIIEDPVSLDKKY